jgi:hypothetical protein
MDIVKELSCDGVAPSGPVSAWPYARNQELMKQKNIQISKQSINATPMQMLRGMASVAGQAIQHGRVSEQIREERYSTCKACPFFIEESKRCSECGCFMEAKTWVGGDPNGLCPKQRWER